VKKVEKAGKLSWFLNASNRLHIWDISKHQNDSAQAWLYGQLFIALVTEKILHHAQLISPWGIPPRLQSLARFPIYASSS
jgi:hypothetical protein